MLPASTTTPRPTPAPPAPARGRPPAAFDGRGRARRGIGGRGAAPGRAPGAAGVDYDAALDAAAPPAPTQGPAAGGPSTDAAAPAAALADVVPRQDALRVPPASTTTPRPTPRASAPAQAPPAALRRTRPRPPRHWRTWCRARTRSGCRRRRLRRRARRPAPPAPTQGRPQRPFDGRGRARRGIGGRGAAPGRALRVPPASTTTPRSTPERHDHGEGESASRRGCGAALLRMFRNLLGRKSQSSKLCGGSAHAPDQDFVEATPAVISRARAAARSATTTRRGRRPRRTWVPHGSHVGRSWAEAAEGGTVAPPVDMATVVPIPKTNANQA